MSDKQSSKKPEISGKDSGKPSKDSGSSNESPSSYGKDSYLPSMGVSGPPSSGNKLSWLMGTDGSDSGGRPSGGTPGKSPGSTPGGMGALGKGGMSAMGKGGTGAMGQGGMGAMGKGAMGGMPMGSMGKGGGGGGSISPKMAAAQMAAGKMGGKGGGGGGGMKDPTKTSSEKGGETESREGMAEKGGKIAAGAAQGAKTGGKVGAVLGALKAAAASSGGGGGGGSSPQMREVQVQGLVGLAVALGLLLLSGATQSSGNLGSTNLGSGVGELSQGATNTPRPTRTPIPTPTEEPGPLRNITDPPYFQCPDDGDPDNTDPLLTTKTQAEIEAAGITLPTADTPVITVTAFPVGMPVTAGEVTLTVTSFGTTVPAGDTIVANGGDTPEDYVAVWNIQVQNNSSQVYLMQHIFVQETRLAAPQGVPPCPVEGDTGDTGDSSGFPATFAVPTIPSYITEYAVSGAPEVRRTGLEWFHSLFAAGQIVDITTEAICDEEAVTPIVVNPDGSIVTEVPAPDEALNLFYGNPEIQAGETRDVVLAAFVPSNGQIKQVAYALFGGEDSETGDDEFSPSIPRQTLAPGTNIDDIDVLDDYEPEPFVIPTQIPRTDRNEILWGVEPPLNYPSPTGSGVVTGGWTQSWACDGTAG